MSEKQGKGVEGPKGLIGKVVSIQLKGREEEWFENVELRSLGADGVFFTYESRSIYHQVFAPLENVNYLIQKFSAPTATAAPTQQPT
jgi:hypothetical protein